MYKGKEKCQGCAKKGDEIMRNSKDELCGLCKEKLKIGQSLDFEDKIKYIGVKDWHNGLFGLDIGDNSLDNFANEVFRSLHNTYATPSGKIDTIRSQHLGSKFYVIPENVAKPFNDLLVKLNEVAKILNKERDKIKEDAKQAVIDEKNEIFNMGVEYGRDLLHQLNRGDITINDFNKTVTKY